MTDVLAIASGGDAHACRVSLGEGSWRTGGRRREDLKRRRNLHSLSPRLDLHMQRVTITQTWPNARAPSGIMSEHARFGLPGSTKLSWHSGALRAPLGPIIGLPVA
eukprot:7913822-Pyramimonas_sp.AAC.1